MKIDFVRTGGFAGLRLEISLDTEHEDRDLASELETLVHDAGILDIPPRRTSQARGFDRYQYRLRVSAAVGGEHRVVVEEPDVPERALPLLSRLTALALARRRSSGPPAQTG